MSGFWDVAPVFVIFPVFALMLKWYFEYRTRKQLIEKGLVDENVKFLQFNKMEQYAPSSLKWGLILLFLGLALIILRILSPYVADEVLIGTMLIAIGLGLLVYYIIADMTRKRLEREGKRPGTGQNVSE
jgi:hypothetical protein